MTSHENAGFTQTHWTTVLRSQGSSASADQALDEVCRTYWPPVYAFIRRKWSQHSPQKAEDLTQSFFIEFTRKLPHLELDPNNGKFRTYLLACLTRFLCKDWKRSSPGVETATSMEELERNMTANAGQDSMSGSPEREFDVAWANALTERALRALSNEYACAGNAQLHERLLPMLTGRAEDGSCSVIAIEQRMSEGAVRVAAHKFRRRFGELLRGEVARTVSNPAETDDELRYLLSLWGECRPK